MKKQLFTILLFFFSLFSAYAQKVDSSDIDNEKMERILNSKDTTESKDDWEFMLRVSKKNLDKKFFWMDKNNLIVNMYKLNYSLDSIEFHLLDYMERDPIHLCDDIRWHREVKFKKYMDIHKKFYAKLDCRCKEEWAKLDSNLIRLVLLMNNFDQKYREKDSDAPWFPSNKDKWIEQGHYDIYNQTLLEHIFKNYGYPSYRKIGVGEIEAIPFGVFLHCSADFQEKHLSLLKTASETEDIPKHFFAQAQDRILMLKGLPQIYGTQLVWNKKAEVLELYKVKDMTKIDQWRKDVDLGKLSKYLKTQKAIIPMKQK